MSLNKFIHCWDILECRETENCKARLFPDVPCWEIDRMFNSSQAVLDVCQECKVYILNENKPDLTETEIQDIIQHREIMKFVKKCPCYNNTLQCEEDINL